MDLAVKSVLSPHHAAPPHHHKFGSHDPEENRVEGDGGEVEVRTMITDDSEFAATMAVESFQKKFEWAVGKRRIPNMIRALAVNYRRNQEDYRRTFIATYHGEKAGMIVLKFSGDTDHVDGPFFSELGCCGWCGLRSYVHLRRRFHDRVPARHCYVQGLGVADGFRGQGIGHALLRYAEKAALARRCTFIYLYVASDSRAMSLYERQGYIQTDDFDGACLSWCSVGVRRFLKMEKRL